MRWILFVIVLSVEKIYGDSGAVTEKSTKNDKSVPSPITNKKNRRIARTLGYDSKENDGIHLHIWNDMNNHDNFYPNVFRHINDGQTEAPVSTISSDSNSVHIPVNMDNIESNAHIPQFSAQYSPQHNLKTALLNTLTLDDFRKSDRDLYGMFYKLNTNQPNNQLPWNYYPSVANYIPKTYETNLNSVLPAVVPHHLPTLASPLQSALPYNMKYYSTPIVNMAPTLRPTLHDQMYAGRDVLHNYYTNLHKNKARSVLSAIGYELGGLPKYSGRLMANEPTPQQYQSFQLYEPVPRQIMMPPPMTRIPMFKPVPPRLKIIPVVEEYLENRAQAFRTDKGQSNQRYPMAPIKVIPFNVHEAITKRPIQAFIPATEQYAPITTEPYKFIQQNFDSYAQIVPSTTPAPYLPIFQSTTVANSSAQTYPSVHYSNELKNWLLNSDYDKSKATNDNELAYSAFDSNQYKHNYDQTQLNKNEVFNTIKSVTVDEYKPNFYANDLSNQQPQQLPQTNTNNDLFVYENKQMHKKLNNTRKQFHSNGQIIKNDVVKLNITGFRAANNDNDNFAKLNQWKSGKAKNVPAQNGTKANPIDSISSDSIQLSTTYSKQTSNVIRPDLMSTKHKKYTPNNQNNLLTQLTNDVSKALLTSYNANDQQYHRYGMDSNEIENKTKEPFLIAVFDENESIKNIMQNDLTENGHHSEVDRSDSFDSESRVSYSNNSKNSNFEQRIDHNNDWTAMDLVKYVKNSATTHNKRDHRLSGESDTTKTTTTTKTVAHTFKPTEQPIASTTIPSHTDSANKTKGANEEKYLNWFNNYAAEKNKKLGRTVISEHFKKVEIEPNVAWVILPR